MSAPLHRGPPTQPFARKEVHTRTTQGSGEDDADHHGNEESGHRGFPSEVNGQGHNGQGHNGHYDDSEGHSEHVDAGEGGHSNGTDSERTGVEERPPIAVKVRKPHPMDKFVEDLRMVAEMENDFQRNAKQLQKKLGLETSGFV